MSFDTETTVYIVLEVLIGFVAVVGNAMVSYVILQNRKFRNMPMYAFIFSLAIADLFVGLVVTPFGILTKLGYPHDRPVLCIAMITFIVIPVFTSVCSLTAVSIERLLAVRYNEFHTRNVTIKSSVVIVAISWIIGVFVGLMPLLGWNKIDWSQWSGQQESQAAAPEIQNSTFYEVNNATNNKVTHECQFVQVVDPDYLFFIFLFCGLFPLSVCAVMYLLIYQHVLKIRKPFNKKKVVSCKSANENQVKSGNSTSQENVTELHANSCDQSATGASVAFSPQKTRKISKKKTRQQNKVEIRVASVLGLTVLGFAVCWLPLHILNTIVRFSSVNLHIPIWVFSIAILLSHANSAINIFLYSWRIDRFHDELKKKVLNKLF